MKNQETSLGGPGESFPETVWSTILTDPASAAGREQLDRLCRRYWKPVYGFIRATGRAPVEEAKDLTQAFFQELLEGDLVIKYQPQRGRFRDFLKGCLRHFLAHDRRNRSAQKRGGGRSPLPLNVGEVETSQFLADLRDRSPDEVFDHQWADQLLESALIRLKEGLEAEGKGVYFQVYDAYYLAAGDRTPTYAEVAQALGLKPHDVGNYLSHARARLKTILRGFISEYAASDQDLREEMSRLLADGS